jgi:hypothetical protein
LNDNVRILYCEGTALSDDPSPPLALLILALCANTLIVLLNNSLVNRKMNLKNREYKIYIILLATLFEINSNEKNWKFNRKLRQRISFGRTNITFFTGILIDESAL